MSWAVGTLDPHPGIINQVPSRHFLWAHFVSQIQNQIPKLIFPFDDFFFNYIRKFWWYFISHTINLSIILCLNTNTVIHWWFTGMILFQFRLFLWMRNNLEVWIDPSTYVLILKSRVFFINYYNRTKEWISLKKILPSFSIDSS